jgi:hypothetical protein
MVEPSKSGRFGWVVHAILMAVSFGLLGLVIWQNRAEIGALFSRPWDLRLLGLAFLRGFIGYVFNLVIPGAVEGDLIKAAYPVDSPSPLIRAQGRGS